LFSFFPDLFPLLSWLQLTLPYFSAIWNNGRKP